MSFFPFSAWDVEATMADQPLPEKPATKVDTKSKEPQKFLYLQLQQDRVSVRLLWWWWWWLYCTCIASVLYANTHLYIPLHCMLFY